jgi:hypothetical protein
MQDMVCLRSGEGGGEFMKLLNIGHDVSSIWSSMGPSSWGMQSHCMAHEHQWHQ